MPRPTEPVKRVCYADDLTVWATGVNIPDLEDIINSYLEEITAYLKDNSLLMSAPKYTVTLFSPDPHQSKTHPRILIEDSQLPLVQCPKILGVYLEQYLQGIDRNILGTTEGDITDDLQGSWEIDHQLCCTGLEYKPAQHKLQKHPIFNEAQRIATGCHKMSSVDHLHVEAKMLKVREYSELLIAQYLARCLEPGNVCHSIPTRETPKRWMKETLFTRHRCRTNDVSG